MSISGKITRYQLACPIQDEHIESPINIIVKYYRLSDDETKMTKEILVSKENHAITNKVYTIERKEQNISTNTRVILYEFDYKIENLTAGIYSVFAYEDSEETNGLLIHPQKQALGWTTNEMASQWAQHTIESSDTNIEHANIILRKPHSFFSANYPRTIEHACFHTMNHIPVLQLNAATLEDRGYSHGFLLAPHILDWFYFYLLEENFQSLTQYNEFYAFVDPTANFFHYPSEYLREIQGILSGMQARTDCDLFLYELNRPFDFIDLLAMNSYIERRTVKPDPRTVTNSSDEPNCSQVVVWNSLTADQRIIAGRNMDGECDIRRVTVSTTVLLAVNNSLNQSNDFYRYISLTWPGLIGTLSGVNETGFYCMENAGPSQIGGRIRGFTPATYIATHVLRTIDARSATKDVVQNAFEAFSCDPKLNQDKNLWPINQAESELKGPVCGPGSVFVLATKANNEGHVFVLEGDRYGGRIRTAMQAPPYIPHCILATNHFLLYGYSEHENFGSSIGSSSMTRYKSMCDRTKDNVAHLNTEDIRAILQSACEGRTEYALEVEIELNGNIIVHIHLAASEFGLWNAPHSSAQTIHFEDFFVSV